MLQRDFQRQPAAKDNFENLDQQKMAMQIGMNFAASAKWEATIYSYVMAARKFAMQDAGRLIPWQLARPRDKLHRVCLSMKQGMNTYAKLLGV
jgi:hypothetical protein